MPDTPSAKTVRMLERLIAFDTTSRNSNLELIRDVERYLTGLGVDCELTYDDAGGKANLFATLGPVDRPGIALSGHTDVVPVNGQDWSSDPFDAVQRDGKFYGRGTCDMKGFLAACLAYAPKFLEARPETPVHLCLSYDEEVGCLGVRKLLADLARRPVKPRMVIVGEPTEMRVVNAHKGKLSMRATVRGLSCHSSLAPQGVNAVEAAARLTVFLSDMARRKAQEGPFDEAFDVPHTTVQAGVIDGGTAVNIVPSECRLAFEFRNLPQDDPRDLLAEAVDFVRREVEPAMQAIDPATGFTFEELASFPALDTEPDAAVVTLTKALARANSTSKVAFGTEAGLFAADGIPAVVCGPGSIEQAHKPDEFITLDQLAQCEWFLDRLLDHVRGG
ncbi:acetylornithine deacetylase [Ferruginivarius sediminum]|uniref:acetylornithine deacetylase n=1 Tax=Ferruginivarius sediminum TaxID=2661937 RepID=UPI001F4EA0CD|nr:acetylornithine deacetylase [Ferruginivarius sediminum]